VNSTDVYLERIDRARNMARYYRLSIAETLFGDWVMVREWGRIGRNGGSREEWCGSHDVALTRLTNAVRQKQRKGYSQMDDEVHIGWPLPPSMARQ
jgi:predicted DNA-binding WGR domain protein